MSHGCWPGRRAETSPIAKATADEVIEKLGWLLALGADPTARQSTPEVGGRLSTLVECIAHSGLARSDPRLVERMLPLLEEHAGALPARHFTSLLFAAAGTGRLKLAWMLLEIKGSIGVDHHFRGGCTALMRALDNANFDLAELLLKSGANPGGWNDCGQTPGYFALKRAAPPNLITMLLDHGMDFMVK